MMHPVLRDGILLCKCILVPHSYILLDKLFLCHRDYCNHKAHYTELDRTSNTLYWLHISRCHTLIRLQKNKKTNRFDTLYPNSVIYRDFRKNLLKTTYYLHHRTDRVKYLAQSQQKTSILSSFLFFSFSGLTIHFPSSSYNLLMKSSLLSPDFIYTIQSILFR